MLFILFYSITLSLYSIYYVYPHFLVAVAYLPTHMNASVQLSGKALLSFDNNNNNA
jgi:hypothetical protein